MLLQTENFSAQPSSREKGPGIENRIAISWLRLGRSKSRRGGYSVCGADWGPHRSNRRNPLGWRALAAGCNAPGAHFTPLKRAAFTLQHYTLLLRKPERCAGCSIFVQIYSTVSNRSHLVPGLASDAADQTFRGFREARSQEK